MSRENKMSRHQGLARPLHLQRANAQRICSDSISNVARKSNKNLVERYYHEMWNQWNFALAGELLAEEISFRGSLGAEMRGRPAFCDYMRRVQRAFPDFHNEITEMVAERERVVGRLNYTGTHRGEIFGAAPTGKKISYAGAAFFRIKNGQIAEGWVLGDLAGLLGQLGLLSLP